MKSPFRKDGFQHYYVRESSGHPIATVAICRGTEPNKIMRGIAICADIDQWDRREGRKKAVGRCKKALNTKMSDDPICIDRLKVNRLAPEAVCLFSETFGIVDKTGYNVEPTAKEANIISYLPEEVTDVDA